MLGYVQGSGKTTDRKLRLFAVACCRRIWHLLNDAEVRNMLEQVEKHVDECGTRDGLQGVIKWLAAGQHCDDLPTSATGFARSAAFYACYKRDAPGYLAAK